MPYISGRYLPVAWIKKKLASQDKQEWLCINPAWVALKIL
jgi:hypothetical protein